MRVGPSAGSIAPPQGQAKAECGNSSSTFYLCLSVLSLGPLHMGHLSVQGLGLSIQGGRCTAMSGLPQMMVNPRVQAAESSQQEVVETGNTGRQAGIL